MEEIRLRANGLHFGALALGEGEERALLLHGFPDDPHSMVPLMERLARRGYRAVAPWMRGYGPTDVPADGDYQVAALASDVVGLLDALEWDTATVFGHDWGAVASYAACNMSPYRVEQLVTMSVPPMRLFLRNALRHPSQFGRSWYMFFFQLPLLPEWWISFDNFAVLEQLWRQVLEAAGRDDKQIEHVKKTFQQTGTLNAAIDYYRALLPRPGGPPGSFTQSWKLATGRIERPTLMFGGERDPAIAIETFEDPDEAFEAAWRLETFRDAGHFIQLQKADEIIDAFDDFAARHAG